MRILGLSVIGACVACGASPAYDAKTPNSVTVPTNEVMVVPADRVVDKCPCGDERTKSVQYVHVTEWQSPAAAQRAEAMVAEDPSRFRASTPAPGALTMHRPIPETRVYRSGWRLW